MIGPFSLIELFGYCRQKTLMSYQIAGRCY